MKSVIKNVLFVNLFSLILAIVLFAGCQQQKPDPSQELKPILDRGVAVWNNGNLDEVDALWDPNVVRNANQLPDVKGIDGIKKVISSFRTAYPDLKLIIDEEIYAENKAIIRWSLTGTNTGQGEMPPTGKKINIWGISLLHFANGKLTREFVAFDNQAIMEQLGFTMMPLKAEEKK
jgi:steroid delta-isomerase-like uncharacterized protein